MSEFSEVLKLHIKNIKKLQKTNKDFPAFEYSKSIEKLSKHTYKNYYGTERHHGKFFRYDRFTCNGQVFKHNNENFIVEDLLVIEIRSEYGGLFKRVLGRPVITFNQRLILNNKIKRHTSYIASSISEKVLKKYESVLKGDYSLHMGFSDDKHMIYLDSQCEKKLGYGNEDKFITEMYTILFNLMVKAGDVAIEEMKKDLKFYI